jgi:hypothetical protein
MSSLNVSQSIETSGRPANLRSSLKQYYPSINLYAYAYTEVEQIFCYSIRW